MMNSKLFPVGCAICFFSLIVFVYSVNYGCQDEEDNQVDWFVLYKLPLVEDHENWLVRRGKAYAYMTSNSNGKWTRSRKAITSKESMPARSLFPLYQERHKRSIFYFLYNDKPPNREEAYSRGGHSKGLVVGDKTGGFWMIHSVPNYVSHARHYEYPRSGLLYGQSFMCITLKPEDLERAGALMQYNDLHIYKKWFKKSLRKMYPNLAKTAYSRWVEYPPWKNSQKIKSAGGMEFQVFAKSQNFHKELYSEWVAPFLKVSLLVQTWPNGWSHQSSSCRGKYKVENVDETEVTGVWFPTTKDHSKWAVSESESQPWVCVGDINKDDSQERRGGGTVCMKDKSVWKAYYNSATLLEKCQRYYTIHL